MKKKLRVSIPSQQNEVDERQSLAISLISEVSIMKGGQFMAKKGGMKNAPSTTGRPSGKGRSNK